MDTNYFATSSTWNNGNSLDINEFKKCIDKISDDIDKNTVILIANKDTLLMIKGKINVPMSVYLVVSDFIKKGEFIQITDEFMKKAILEEIRKRDSRIEVIR